MQRDPIMEWKHGRSQKVSLLGDTWNTFWREHILEGAHFYERLSQLGKQRVLQTAAEPGPSRAALSEGCFSFSFFPLLDMCACMVYACVRMCKSACVHASVHACECMYAYETQRTAFGHASGTFHILFEIGSCIGLELLQVT